MPARSEYSGRWPAAGVARPVAFLSALATVVLLAPAAGAQARGVGGRARGARAVPTPSLALAPGLREAPRQERAERRQPPAVRARMPPPGLRARQTAPAPALAPAPRPLSVPRVVPSLRVHGVRREQARIVRKLIRQARRVARRLRSSRALRVTAPAATPTSVAPTPAPAAGASTHGSGGTPASGRPRTASSPVSRKRRSRAGHGHARRSASVATAGQRRGLASTRRPVARSRGSRRGRRADARDLLLVRDARPQASGPDAGGAGRRGGAALAPAAPSSARLPGVAPAPAADGSPPTIVVLLAALALVAVVFVASLGYRPRRGPRGRRGRGAGS